MKTALLLIVVLALGCGNNSSPAPKDPNVKVQIDYNGPAGTGWNRKYEGPVSEAPDWAKRPQQPTKK
jgi:hypothetical protein